MSGFDMDAFRARLQALMDDRAIKAKPLGKAAGLGETSIRDIMKKDGRGVSAGTLVALAGYFNISVDDLLHDNKMQLSGMIGAGGEILFGEEDPDLPIVSRPPGADDKVIALKVVGASMLPKYEDGDVIYVRRDHDGVVDGAIGEYCAVRTAEGGTFLKILARGSTPGRFTLRSLNAPDMEDVEVVWAAPVQWVRHRAFAD